VHKEVVLVEDVRARGAEAVGMLPTRGGSMTKLLGLYIDLEEVG